MASAELGPRSVWVDLANSPQVLFFHKIIARWKSQGMEVLTTSRPHAQTIPLIEQFGIAHTPIGLHGGRRMLGLGLGLIERAAELAAWASGRGIDVAVSHNSYAQILAASWKRIPTATTMDFEHHWANHIAFRLAKRVVVPAPFPEAALRRFGAVSRTIRYPGVKEQLYLDEGPVDLHFRREHGLSDGSVLAVVRPAAEGAAYHRRENPLIRVLLEHLATYPSVDLVFLPRSPAQRDMLGGQWRGRGVVPDGSWNGQSLLRAADVVFSGGGTMVREAAVLGTPAYSLFSGPTIAVDEYLARLGRLTFLRTSDDVRAIVPRRKSPGMGLLAANDNLLQCVSMALLGHPSPPCQ